MADKQVDEKPDEREEQQPADTHDPPPPSTHVVVVVPHLSEHYCRHARPPSSTRWTGREPFTGQTRSPRFARRLVLRARLPALGTRPPSSRAILGARARRASGR